MAIIENDRRRRHDIDIARHCRDSLQGGYRIVNQQLLDDDVVIKTLSAR